MFNDNTTVRYEVFPDAKRDVFDMFARWIKLSIHAIDMNPWEEVGVHQSPVGCREDMSFAFRLGYDGSVNVVEVECDHVLLWKLRAQWRCFLGGRSDGHEVALKISATFVLANVDEVRATDQITFGLGELRSVAAVFAFGFQSAIGVRGCRGGDSLRGGIREGSVTRTVESLRHCREMRKAVVIERSD